MSESKSNDKVESTKQKRDGIKLRPDQIEVLARHKNLRSQDKETEVVTKEEKRLLDVLAVDPEAVINGMDNPAVIDRGGLSRDSVTDSLEALRSLRDPVVAERDDVEALNDCERGLREVVAGSLGVDRDVVESMGARPLADFIQHASEEDDQPKLTTLSQTPESGSSHDIDASAASPSGVEALSAGDRDDILDKIAKHERMKNRTPEHAENLKNDALEMVDGIDDFDELREEINY